MCIQFILPLTLFSHLLFTAYILPVVAGARRIIDFVPIYRSGLLHYILLSLLAATALTLLARVKPIDIVIVSGPVSQGASNSKRSRWLGSIRGFVRQV